MKILVSLKSESLGYTKAKPMSLKQIEGKHATAVKMLTKAEDALKANPSDKLLKMKLKDAQNRMKAADRGLGNAKARQKKKEAAKGKLEKAREAVAEAKAKLKEANAAKRKAPENKKKAAQLKADRIKDRVEKLTQKRDQLKEAAKNI
jgi:chromosome segregation ATPase